MFERLRPNRFVRRQTWPWACAVAAILMGGWPAVLPAEDQIKAGTEFFESQVRPVLVEHCQKCHGPQKQEAGLRLDSRAGLFAGGENGPAIVAGKPDESRLIAAVRRTGDVEMPPDGRLEAKAIEALVEWVRMGAPWPEAAERGQDNRAEAWRRHWAFQPIADPAPPVVGDDARQPAAIDRFVLARLEAAGLPPSPAADRRTLIRRASYDLTGLPPTPEEVATFVADGAPDAYPRLIERLLASPRYGEHWARHWLDVARYSDTKGYVYGREERFWVHAPAYRDWVVEAFNRDLPYDRFLLLQIAADSVAPDDRGALAAMGFLTVGRRFLGVARDIIDDRIDVVTRGTMGLSVACARCHDHKYDPIPTADYYSLYSIFLNSTEQLTPIADPPTTDETYPAYHEELLRRQKAFREALANARAVTAERVRARLADYLIAQTELSKYPEEGFDLLLQADELVPNLVRRWESWLAADARLTDPVFLPWRRLAALKADEFADQAPAILRELADAGPAVNPHILAALGPRPSRCGKSPSDTRNGSARSTPSGASACEAARSAGAALPTALASSEDEAIRQCLYAADSPCLIPDEAISSIEFYFDNPTVSGLWNLQGEVDRWLINSPLAPPHALALVDRQARYPARVFRRGNPANRGPDVVPHFVSAVAGANPPAFHQGSGRLELAQAITDRTNPLTARVWVNRIWQHHFGLGLVRTTSDFGLRAETPSHPELLDWLASRLVDGGWSTKNIQRLIMLSATYQQQSTPPVDETLRQALGRLDPENRLLSRMNAHRLGFEEFRDTLLSVAGRLDVTAGGRATDLWAAGGTSHRRRTLYGLVDRQFLPSTFRVFDFANPDLHIPARIETTVPQQALFALNHPFVAQQARALAARVGEPPTSEPAEIVRRLYRAVYQREPTAAQLAAALALVIGRTGRADGRGFAGEPGLAIWLWRIGPGDGESEGFSRPALLQRFGLAGGTGLARRQPGLGAIDGTGGAPRERFATLRRAPLGGAARRQVFGQFGADP